MSFLSQQQQSESTELSQTDIYSTSTIVQELLFNVTRAIISSEMDNNRSDADNNNNDSLIRYRLLYRNYHGYISSVVCIFGLTCNLFNIIVLTRPLMRSSTNIILTSLALSDLLKMSFVLPSAIMFYCLPEPDRKSEPDPRSYFQMKYYMVCMLFTLTSHCISTWLTVYLAAFRYIFLRCKALANYVSSPDRAFIGVSLVALVSTILCIPSYMEQHIVEEKYNDSNVTINDYETTVAYRFEETAFSKSLSLRKITFVLHSVLFKLVPCAFLLLFSFLLIQQLRNALEKAQALNRTASTKANRMKSIARKRTRKREKENRRTTLMLVIVCALFLVTELPQGAILLMTFLSKNNDAYFQIYQHLGDTFDILALINNSVNFILYCLMSQAFRDTFEQTFCFCQKIQINPSTLSVTRKRRRKHRQKPTSQSVGYEIVSMNKCSQNGQLHATPLMKSLSDSQTRMSTQTLTNLQCLSRSKSASL